MHKIILSLLLTISFQLACADYTTDCLKGKKNSTACQNMLKRYWKYNELIEKIGREEGVDPSLLKALIAYESSYNASARSHANAKGLTQVIPGTAKQHGINNSQYLYIPEVSIRTGAKELAKQWRNFGRLDLTLAAYNAGAGAVKKYGNKVPPYAETTAYVKNIARLYQEFKTAERVKAPLASLNVTPQNIQAQVSNARFHYQSNLPQISTPQNVQVAYNNNSFSNIPDEPPTPKKKTKKPKTKSPTTQLAQNSAFKTVIAN